MKDDSNFRWTMEDIAHQYKIENQNWTWSKCWDKARIIYRELKRLNSQMWYDNKLHFKMTTPFSFFEGDENFLGSIPELDEI